MGRFIATVALGALVTSTSLLADSWPQATVKEVFSQSRERFVRLTPGKSLGDTFGFAGSPKGHYATAEFYRRRPDRSYAVVADTTLVNPIAPVHFLVTDRGYLVTLDNWHNVGYGRMLATYAPSGKLIAAYALSDLFSPAEIQSFSHSTSSIHWRTTETIYVREGQHSIYVSIDGKGRDMIVEAATGVWQVCEQRDGLYQCRDSNARRAWRPFREPTGPRE
jgi:hypothetical protein